MCGDDEPRLYRIFMTGFDGTPMPSFADVIKPEQAWDLVHFLRTLQTTLKPPEYATFTQWVDAHPNQLKPIGQEAAPGIGQYEQVSRGAFIKPSFFGKKEAEAFGCEDMS